MKSYWKHYFIDNHDIALIEAGVQKNLPSQINDYTVHHDYVIHIVLSGKGYFVVNHQHYELQKNDCFILKKDHHVYYEPDRDDPWTIGWIALGGKNIDHYLKDTIITHRDTFHFKEDSAVYYQIIELITFLETINPQMTSNKLKIIGLLYNLLAEINLELIAPSTSIRFTLPEVPQLAQNIRHYLKTNYHLPITIEEVALHFSISRSYLFQICKKYFNLSPKQILLESRMAQAACLLRSSQLKISEISEQVGYRDTFQFSKMFKNYFGHSPSQYRILSDETIDDSVLTLPILYHEKSLLNTKKPNVEIWL